MLDVDGVIDRGLGDRPDCAGFLGESGAQALVVFGAAYRAQGLMRRLHANT